MRFTAFGDFIIEFDEFNKNTFTQLKLEDRTVVIPEDDIYSFIALTETFKFFIKNLLKKEIEYSYSAFKAKVVEKNGIVSLRIIFKNSPKPLYFLKIDCQIYSVFFSKFPLKI